MYHVNCRTEPLADTVIRPMRSSFGGIAGSALHRQLPLGLRTFRNHAPDRRSLAKASCRLDAQVDVRSNDLERRAVYLCSSRPLGKFFRSNGSWTVRSEIGLATKGVFDWRKASVLAPLFNVLLVAGPAHFQLRTKCRRPREQTAKDREELERCSTRPSPVPHLRRGAENGQNTARAVRCLCRDGSGGGTLG